MVGSNEEVPGDSVSRTLKEVSDVAKELDSLVPLKSFAGIVEFNDAMKELMSAGSSLNDRNILLLSFSGGDVIASCCSDSFVGDSSQFRLVKVQKEWKDLSLLE